MKHPWNVTLTLVLLFVASQVIGLSLLSLNIESIQEKDGAVVVSHDTTVLGDRPQTSGFGSVLFLAIGVGLGTILLLILIKYRVFSVWKLWFFLAVWLSTSIAFGVIMSSLIAIVLCFGLAFWKIYYPNPIIHNLTEIFMYAGLGILLAPLFTVFWMIVVLIGISIYDIIAVWHSKHMVVMGEAQTKNNLFAGLYVPRTASAGERKMMGRAPTPKVVMAKMQTAGKKSDKTAMGGKTNSNTGGTAVETKNQPRAAVLGGGDMAFPLLFSGVAMDWLITQGMSIQQSLYMTLIITGTTTFALFLLFYYAKKDRYYPAMPFLSAGCFLGLGIVWLFI